MIHLCLSQYDQSNIEVALKFQFFLNLVLARTKSDEASMHRVNRVGEIYVDERETKGKQRFRKMFVL